jgi:hypothetical protein
MQALKMGVLKKSTRPHRSFFVTHLFVIILKPDILLAILVSSSSQVGI